jgi:1,4-dihydroxy-6-naphthoate synthase
VREVTFGFSPCPNDTFSFHALVHGLVEAPVPLQPVLLDIEKLNRHAREGSFELTKLSFGALAAAAGRYRLLRAGAAVGTGVGPLLVAREQCSLSDAASGPIAIPGYDTTAFLLLRLAAREVHEVVELPYHAIVGAVAAGEVDAGLIIHESRFTYPEHGLVEVADLGRWWEAETGLPLPLAGIWARRDLDPRSARDLELAVRRSVEYALAHPAASRAYVREHAQELSDDVCDAHIRLYVNELSIDLGEQGRAAVEELLNRSAALRPLGADARVEFVA